MPAAYSIDLRTKVVQAYKDGRGTIKEVANLFNIAEKTLKNYLAREKQCGNLEEDIRIGKKSSVEEHHRCYIKQRILDEPSIRLLDLCEELKSEYNLTVSESWMCKIVKKIGFVRKKKHYFPSEQLLECIKKKERIF